MRVGGTIDFVRRSQDRGETAREECLFDSLWEEREVGENAEPAKRLPKEGKLLIRTSNGLSNAFAVMDDGICTEIGQVFSLLLCLLLCVGVGSNMGERLRGNGCG
jgi:hypothetical protein